MNVLVLVILFFVLFASSLPLVFVLGIICIVMIGLFSGAPLIMVPEIMYNSLYKDSLMAIPFFVAAATFMTRGGVTRVFINAAKALVGDLPGGMAIVCVISSMFFAAICGSSTATAIAMGLIIVPSMADLGYSRAFGSGLVASSGTMGIMIPPSIAFILYGILTEVSIPRLFLAGILPGVLEGVLYIIWIVYYSKRKGYRGEPRKGVKEIVSVFAKALPATALPIIVMGGIYSGIATVTEAAALAAVASVFLTIFVYKEITFRQVVPIFGESMKMAGMIMIIISIAIVFGVWLTQARIPDKLIALIVHLGLPWWGFILIVNCGLLALGTVMEGISILLITLPILFPLLEPLGIDPVHYAVITVLTGEIGVITPPLGVNLFALSGATQTPLPEVIRGAFPFVILGLVELAIVSYWPAFSLFLPKLIMGP